MRYRAMYKSRLAKYAGVSLRTLPLRSIHPPRKHHFKPSLLSAHLMFMVMVWP